MRTLEYKLSEQKDWPDEEGWWFADNPYGDCTVVCYMDDNTHEIEVDGRWLNRDEYKVAYGTTTRFFGPITYEIKE